MCVFVCKAVDDHALSSSMTAAADGESASSQSQEPSTSPTTLSFAQVVTQFIRCLYIT